MRITEGQLRRIIREELLREGMFTPEYAAEKGLRFTVDVFRHVIDITVTQGDAQRIVGQLRAVDAESYRELACLNAWEITRSAAAPNLDGLGPLMYDLMLDLVPSGILASDRSIVRPPAKRVWDHYMTKRPDIEWMQLDNPEDEITPGVPDDNCHQTSAEIWARPDEDIRWRDTSLSKAYRRRDGRTPVRDALEGLGIIDIVT